MLIRTMMPSDHARVFDLWTSTPGMGLRALDDSAAGLGKFLNRNPTTCFVAEEDGALAGAILSGHDGRRGHIYHTVVAPSRRRRGVGKALVEAVEEAMRREGIHKMALLAFADNNDGRLFWEALGFASRPDLVYRNKSLNPENA